MYALAKWEGKWSRLPAAHPKGPFLREDLLPPALPESVCESARIGSRWRTCLAFVLKMTVRYLQRWLSLQESPTAVLKTQDRKKHDREGCLSSKFLLNCLLLLVEVTAITSVTVLLPQCKPYRITVLQESYALYRSWFKYEPHGVGYLCCLALSEKESYCI